MFGGPYFGQIPFAGNPAVPAGDITGTGDLQQAPATMSGVGVVPVTGGGKVIRKKVSRTQWIPHALPLPRVVVYGDGRLAARPATMSGRGALTAIASGNIQAPAAVMQGEGWMLDEAEELQVVLSLIE